MSRQLKALSLRQPPRRAQALLVTANAVLLGAAFMLCTWTASAFAQVVPPAPSPFQAPIGAPPVTSSSANGRLGAAPIAPRADQLTPAIPIDAGAARAAAARGLPAGDRNAVISEGAAGAAAVRPGAADTARAAGATPDTPPPTPGLVIHPKPTAR